MNQCIINGKFMADHMMGIVRYAREILSELDNLLDEDIKVTLAVPPDAKNVPAYRNIHLEQVGKHSGILWEQTDFRHYVRRHPDALCVNLCNVAPLLVKPGITVIHDIMYRVNPSHYTTVRNRISRLWHMLQYRYLCSRERVIVTDSIYSRSEIEKYYPYVQDKIKVIPCAWQHVKNYHESEDWQERYPFLKDGKYYFSLASRAKNKNGIWIFHTAKNNPDSVFAIAGQTYQEEHEPVPENVRMLGFIPDDDACALIKHCRAFVYPSLYEGFGLPPLEALALGAKVISSNATSLPEVLGNSVHYIDPNNADVDLEQLLKQPVEAADIALDRFSWRHSAELWLEIMENRR